MEISGTSLVSHSVIPLPYTKVVYFTNSGGEAVELAMVMSRLHTGSFDIVSLRYVSQCSEELL